jgi:hypothetical protein
LGDANGDRELLPGQFASQQRMQHKQGARLAAVVAEPVQGVPDVRLGLRRQ